MRRSQIFIVSLSIVAGYILATALNRPSVGQPPLPTPVAQEGQVLRYQVTTAGGGSYPELFLTDTVTGRIWSRASNPDDNQGWHPYGSPASIHDSPVGK
jgi:hypothetical protein